NGQPSEIWDATKLFGLKEKNWWHHPHVKDVDEIKGLVGVFWDQDDENFFIRIDPDYHHESGAFLNHDLSRPYRPLVEGDKEAVITAAKSRLRELN
ncbi:MAG: hypothetical protein Q8Q23_02380, partial [bacterium]|nr:hypothetical protein [bacterium]